MKKGLLLTIVACLVLLPACCWRDWCFWRKRCHRDDCDHRHEYVEKRHERVTGCEDGSCRRRVRRSEKEEVVMQDGDTRLAKNGRVVYH